MLISISWLQEYFKDSLPKAEEIARVLTMHSNEVEGIEEITLPSGAKDMVLDFKVLPNRAADLLCHYGLAKELGVLLDRPLKPRPVAFAGVEGLYTKDKLTLAIEDEALCLRAAKRYAEDVNVLPSPAWLIDRLAAVGQRSINNVVDISNYVMLSYGQPCHTFDYDKLAGDSNMKEVTVRTGKRGERIIALDDVEYALDDSVIVIADAEKPLDIAGIKGGKSSMIDEGTKRVMLSCCSFSPASIRKTAQKLNLRTDASKRFENNIAREQVALGMEELSRLMARLTGARIAEDVIDIFKNKRERHVLTTTRERIIDVIGCDVSASEIGNILERFSVCAGWEWKLERDTYVVVVPYERSDMYPDLLRDEYASGVEQDLIEEIARVYGYENIPAVLPIEVERPPVLPTYYRSEQLRHFFIERGFSELLTYSFVDKRASGAVRVENPIASDKKYLRTALAPALLERLLASRSQKDVLGIDQVKVFEIGHVFDEEGERIHLALAIEDLGHDHDAKEDAKQVIRDMENMLNIKNIKYDLYTAGGIKHGIVETDLESLVALLPTPVAGEPLPEQGIVSTAYEPISPYPHTIRDIAVWMDGSREALAELLRDKAGSLLVALTHFDTYEDKVGGRSSHAFRLVFQSKDRTLTNDEIVGIMKEIDEAVKAKGWTVR